jgi:TolB protein
MAALLLAGGAGGASHAAPPQDGRLIAFQGGSAGGSDVFVMHADGSGQRDLTPNTVQNHLADWSLDGERIAFSSSRDGNEEVYVMAADGSGQQRLTRNPAYDADPTWRPTPG